MRTARLQHPPDLCGYTLPAWVMIDWATPHPDTDNGMGWWSTAEHAEQLIRPCRSPRELADWIRRWGLTLERQDAWDEGVDPGPNALAPRCWICGPVTHDPWSPVIRCDPAKHRAYYDAFEKSPLVD